MITISGDGIGQLSKNDRPGNGLQHYTLYTIHVSRCAPAETLRSTEPTFDVRSVFELAPKNRKRRRGSPQPLKSQFYHETIYRRPCLLFALNGGLQ